MFQFYWVYLSLHHSVQNLHLSIADCTKIKLALMVQIQLVAKAVYTIEWRLETSMQIEISVCFEQEANWVVLFSFSKVYISGICKSLNTLSFRILFSPVLFSKNENTNLKFCIFKNFSKNWYFLKIVSLIGWNNVTMVSKRPLHVLDLWFGPLDPTCYSKPVLLK